MGKHRTDVSNRHLGFVLAFVAGAINAGGFFAVDQSTSHMTGVVTAMANQVALGVYDLVLVVFLALLFFVIGAATSSILVNYARYRKLHAEYALPLLIEAIILMCFGFFAGKLTLVDGFVPMTVILLSFSMGLQNALITKISKAEIRTTHLTGTVTDIGIELGRLVYGFVAGKQNEPEPAKAVDVVNKRKLKLLSCLLAFFFMGGMFGALSFHHLGYVTALPLAFTLAVMAIAPVLDDLFGLRLPKV